MFEWATADEGMRTVSQGEIQWQGSIPTKPNAPLALNEHFTLPHIFQLDSGWNFQTDVIFFGVTYTININSRVFFLAFCTGIPGIYPNCCDWIPGGFQVEWLEWPNCDTPHTSSNNSHFSHHNSDANQVIHTSSHSCDNFQKRKLDIITCTFSGGLLSQLWQFPKKEIRYHYMRIFGGFAVTAVIISKKGNYMPSGGHLSGLPEYTSPIIYDLPLIEKKAKCSKECGSVEKGNPKNVIFLLIWCRTVFPFRIC
jgi:hypothetical protein